MKINLKSILNASWKLGLGLFGTISFLLGILITLDWYDSTYGHVTWKDVTLSNDVVVMSYHNNCVRVRNRVTGRFTTPKLRWVSGIPERDSLTVFCDRSGRRGYLDVKTGEIVIAAQYDKAWNFSEGLGAVLGKNGRVGFIDRGNRLVIDCTIPYEKGFDYLFRDGTCLVRFWRDDRYLSVLYGRDGRTLLPEGNYTRLDEANADGYRVVENEEGCFLYDREFHRVFEEPAEAMELNRESRGVFVTRNHVKQLLDFGGRVLEPFVIDGTYDLRYLVREHPVEPDEYETVPDLVVYRVDGWEGLMDRRNGRVITPALYRDFSMISKELIRAELDGSPYGSESVVMDRNGKVVTQ